MGHAAAFAAATGAAITALLAAGCAHSAGGRGDRAETLVVTVDAAPPNFTYAPDPAIGVASKTTPPALRGAGSGALTGTMIGFEVMRPCWKAFSASPYAGTVVCVLTVPVALVAIPVGAVVGAIAATASAPDRPERTTSPPDELEPKEIGPPPSWWMEPRRVVAERIAKHAAAAGYVVEHEGTSPANTRVEVALESLGLTQDRSPRAFVTVRARRLVDHEMSAQRTVTCTCFTQNEPSEWLRNDGELLRVAIGHAAREAATSLATELRIAPESSSTRVASQHASCTVVAESPTANDDP